MSAIATPVGAAAPLGRVPGARGLEARRDGVRLGRLRQAEAKHLAAVARTLQWADESAERGDHFDAIAWLKTLEAIGDKLPEVYEIRRDSWLPSSARTRTTRQHPP